MTFKTPGRIVPVALKICGVPTLPMDAHDQHLFKNTISESGHALLKTITFFTQ